MTTTWLWYTTRGAGLVSLLLLTAVTVLGVLSVARFEAAGWPRFVTTGFHRNLSLLAVVFLALHIVTAVVDPFTHLGWTAAAGSYGALVRKRSKSIVTLLSTAVNPICGGWTP